MDISSLKIAIDSRDALTAKSNLDNLNTSSKTTQSSIGGLTNSTAMLSLKNIALGVTMTYLLKEGIKLSDTWTSISSRLNLATKSTEEYTKAQKELFKIAQTTKTSLEGTVDLYSRIARSTESLKLSQNTLLSITETINKTGIISGASAQQMNAGLMQLGQAFSAGALRGEELNSVLEQMPRLAKAIADGMKIEVGALKDVASQGKITSKVLIDAITSQTDSINNEFNGMAMTIDQASTTAGNSILALVGKLNDATGASKDAANSIKEFSQFLDDNANSIVEWGIVAYASTSQLADGVNLLWETLENTAQLVLAGINTTVYGALRSVSGAILNITEALNKLGLSSDTSLSSIKVINDSLNESYEYSKKLAVDSSNEISDAYKKASLSATDRIKMMTVEKQISMENAEMAKVVSDEQTKISNKKIELTKEEIKALKDAQKAEENKNKALLEIAQIGMSEYEKSLTSINEKYQSWIEAGVNINTALDAQLQLITELNAQTLSETLLEDLSYYERKVQLQSDSLAKELELQAISYANAVLNIENSDKTIEQKERLIALETELYGLSIARLEEDSNTEFQDTLLEFQDEALQRQIALNESMYEFGDSFGGIAKQVSTASKAVINMNTIAIKGKKEESKLNEKYTKEFLKYADDEIKTKELVGQYEKDNSELKQQNQEAEMAGYANLAGAMASAFEQGSAGAIAFTTLQATLGIASSWTAIATAWALPFPSNIPAVAMVSSAVMPIIAQLTSMGGSGGGGGGSSPSIQEIDKFNIESTYNPMIDKLDRQIELLESIDKNGSAAKLGVDLAAMTYERDYKLFVNESYTDLHNVLRGAWGVASGTANGRSQTEAALEEYLGFNLANKGGSGLPTEEEYIIDRYALTQGENFMRLIEAANTSLIRGTDWEVLFDKDWKQAGSPGQMMEARIADFTNQFQELLSEYTLALLDSMDELKDAKEDFKGFYDDITGTSFYANQDLDNAFKEVNKYLNGKPLTTYLQEEVENISKLQSFLTEDKINILLMEDPTKLKEQLDIVEDLREQTGLTFENGAEDALNYLDAIELVSEAMAASRENIKDFIDSFKSENLLATDLASSMGLNLATTWDELKVKLREMSSDTLGLTDEDLNFLETNKSYIERLQELEEEGRIQALESQKDLNQTLKDEANKTLSEIKSNISTIDSILKSLTSTIDKLRGNADNTNTYTLDKFYESMRESQELIKRNDYEAIQKSIQETIGFSSALNDAKNFALNRDMRYAQLVAANQFESMDVTLNDELDYLKLIEENTANTVDTLAATLTALGVKISDSINNNSDKFDEYAKELEKAINTEVDTGKTKVASAFENVFGTTPDTSTSGFNYWVNELKNNPNITESNLESSIALGASNKEDVLKSLEWFKSNNIKLGSSLLDRSYANGLLSDYEANSALDKYGIPTFAYSDSILNSKAFPYDKFKQMNIDSGLLQSFAVGTTNVPYDMMANIHQGESIIPKTFTDGIRDGEMYLGNIPQLPTNNNSFNIDVLVDKMVSKFNDIISISNKQLTALIDTRDINNDSLVYLQKIEKVI